MTTTLALKTKVKDTTPILEIRPQPGPQEQFLGTIADVAFYGGAAGGGKSFALLIEPLRHMHNGDFGGVIFRRSTVQIRNTGGLWDESERIYQPLGGMPRQSVLEWNFPSRFNMKFAHLEHEKTVLDYQGAQIPYIGWDELTHFTEKQFTYMMSRNRSSSGVPGYIRGTCNPDVDSWVRKWIDWYIGEDGFPIKERAGKIRWFYREGDEMHWGNSREELGEQFGELAFKFAKSFTFIPSKLSDNKILMKKDPAYEANLRALSRVERMRLLDGNWNVRATAGQYFQRGWFPIIKALPAGYRQVVRYWDKAATKPNETNKDPDWTAGVKLYGYPDGTWVVGHVAKTRDTPLQVEKFVKNIASQDGHRVAICVEQEPGSAGVADAGNFVRLLAGYNVRVRKPTKDKITRALPVSAQAEQGNIKVLEGDWNDAFLQELQNFDEDCAHDDQVDGLSGAFNEMAGNVSICDVL